jgi:hypothetical protein
MELNTEVPKIVVAEIGMEDHEIKGEKLTTSVLLRLTAPENTYQTISPCIYQGRTTLRSDVEYRERGRGLIIGSPSVGCMTIMQISG